MIRVRYLLALPPFILALATAPACSSSSSSNDGDEDSGIHSTGTATGTAASTGTTTLASATTLATTGTVATTATTATVGTTTGSVATTTTGQGTTTSQGTGTTTSQGTGTTTSQGTGTTTSQGTGTTTGQGTGTTTGQGTGTTTTGQGSTGTGSQSSESSESVSTGTSTHHSTNTGTGTGTGTGVGTTSESSSSEASSAGCVPKTCAELNFQCGNQGDGCGSYQNCGTCTGSTVCTGNGVCGTATTTGTCASPPTALPSSFVPPTGIVGTGCSTAEINAEAACDVATTMAGQDACNNTLTAGSGSDGGLNSCGECIEAAAIEAAGTTTTWGPLEFIALEPSVGDATDQFFVNAGFNFGGCIIGKSPSAGLACGLDEQAADACAYEVCLPLCAVPDTNPLNQADVNALFECVNTVEAEGGACAEFITRAQADCAPVADVFNSCVALYDQDSQIGDAGAPTKSSEAEYLTLVCGGN